MDDPIEQMARAAEQRMLADGVNDLTDKEFTLVLSYWSVRRMERSHAEQVKQLTNGNGNGGKKGVLKRHAPSAGAGFGLATVLAFFRDFLGGGG